MDRTPGDSWDSSPISRPSRRVHPSFQNRPPVYIIMLMIMMKIHTSRSTLQPSDHVESGGSGAKPEQINRHDREK